MFPNLTGVNVARIKNIVILIFVNVSKMNQFILKNKLKNINNNSNMMARIMWQANDTDKVVYSLLYNPKNTLLQKCQDFSQKEILFLHV